MREAFAGLYVAGVLYAGLYQMWRLEELAGWRKAAQWNCEQSGVTWEGIDYLDMDQCVESWMRLVRKEFGL